MPIPKKKIGANRKLAKTLVYETMKEWIVNGTLAPGEKLVDSEISKYFSVSRTPVREAFHMLAEQKLVEIEPSKGTKVTLIDLDDLCSIYETLSIIHGAAIKFSFDKLDSKILTKLKIINREMILAIKHDEFEKLYDLDNEFHNIFIELYGNPYITNINSVLQIHVKRAETLNFKLASSSLKSQNEHSKIISAIENNNKTVAIKEMENNWLRFIKEDYKNFNNIKKGI